MNKDDKDYLDGEIHKNKRYLKTTDGIGIWVHPIMMLPPWLPGHKFKNIIFERWVDESWFNGCKCDEYIPKYSNYPKSVITFDRDKNYLHPTQKPVELLEYLIKTYTNEKETVLDNCMGSGSTGVACVNTNRNFIGIELDENYFNIAKERINSIVREDWYYGRKG